MDSLLLKCNDSYVPTSREYLTALGSFGTSALVVGGLITVSLFILFFEQVLYTHHNAHYHSRRHIYWITSVYPFLTLMSIVALVVPRAHNACTAVKQTYMSIGICHFSDLTKMMFGGEELMVARAQGTSFNLRQSPLCCCCSCLPAPPVSKVSVRLVSLLTDQLPYSQFMYYFSVLVLLADGNIKLGDVNPTGPYLWLNVFNLTACCWGVYGLMILSNFSKGHLDDFNYTKKSLSMRLLLLVTNFQNLIFSIMAYNNVFPCIAPFVSHTVYRQTVENSVYLLEMMLLGPFTFWQYHNRQFAFPVTTLPTYINGEATCTRKDTQSTTATVVTTLTDTSSSTSEAGDTSGGALNADGVRSVDAVGE